MGPIISWVSFEKNTLPLPGFDPHIAQPVALSLYQLFLWVYEMDEQIERGNQALQRLNKIKHTGGDVSTN
jgi:hypothetical protein